jgi:hypothetical protein
MRCGKEKPRVAPTNNVGGDASYNCSKRGRQASAGTRPVDAAPSVPPVWKLGRDLVDGSGFEPAGHV